MVSFLQTTLLLGIIVSITAVDKTRTPGGNGAEVVETVVDLIRQSCLFADDKRFLRRLAYVQSTDGTDPKTYRPGFDGGIWQVGYSKFLETLRNSTLAPQYQIINDKFNIDWNHIEWSDLRKPLYSGIAAALYTILHGGVGWRTEDQALFYSQQFQTTTGNNFTNLAQILDQGCQSNKEIDIVFAVDRSCSLSRDDFARAKLFMQNVIAGFNISYSATRVGVVSYSSSSSVEFYLNEHTTKTDVSNAINGMQYQCGTTATDEAILKAVDDVMTATHGSRNTAAKVLIVITDGNSNDIFDTKHAAEKAHGQNIVTFAVGVGSLIGKNELDIIGTTPSCTHVFTVNDYSEIKALKEEIQKSTCRAPVYIRMNHTYSCIMGKCPPLAVVTPTGGVTVETNVTCGRMNVYTAFSNPYPGDAFYEEKQETSVDNLGVQFRNTTSLQTLYIGLKDTSTGGSDGCTVHVTPYTGDHRNHEMKCYKDGVLIECPDTCKENWNYNVHCDAHTLSDGKLKYPHPTDTTKYLMFDLACKLYIVQCPQNETYYQSCESCVGANTPCSSLHTPLGNQIQNPCSPASILAGHFFFTYPLDTTKYIHCDVWGKAWVRPCPDGEEWDQHELTCIIPASYANPCHDNTDGHFVQFFPYPCDPAKYIQCDLWKESFVRDCYPGYYYDLPSSVCVPKAQAHVTTNTQSNCDALNYHSPSTSSPQQVHQVATTAGTSPGYDFCRGCNPFSLPCTRENINKGFFYFPVRNDRHHYIQCDVSGHMTLRMCTNGGKDFFDAVTSTCVDGSLQIDNIIG